MLDHSFKPARAAAGIVAQTANTTTRIALRNLRPRTII
jgi:hypothetical protein